MPANKVRDLVEESIFPRARPDVRRFRDALLRGRPTPEERDRRKAHASAGFRRDSHPSISVPFILGMAAAALSIRGSGLVVDGFIHPLADEAYGMIQASLVLGFLSVAAMVVGLRFRPPREPGTGALPDIVTGAVNLVLVAVFAFLNLLVLPQAEALTDHSPLGAATQPVKVVEGGRSAILATRFLKGTRAELEKALDANPGVRTLYLMSPGGNAREGAQMAEMVRKRRLRTRALVYCNSACADVFVAGVGRDIPTLHKDALGFHSGGLTGVMGPLVRSDAFDQKKLLMGYGVTEAFADKATGTPFEDIWQPDTAELLAGNAADGTYGPYEGPGFVWAFEGTAARASAKAVPAWLAGPLEVHAPAVLADVKDFTKRAHSDARNPRRVADVWRPAAARVLARAVSEAPDAIVLKAGGYLLSGMAAAGLESSAVCVRLGARPDLILASRHAPNPQGGNSDTPWLDLANAAFGNGKAEGWPAGISLPDPADEAVWAVKHGPDTPPGTCAEARRPYMDAVAKADAGAVAWLRDRFAAFAAGSGAPERHDLTAFR